jgi:rhamnulokinase
MSKELITLAVDLGAESGRVMAVHFDGESLRVEELHRFANGPVDVRGTLHWDVVGLWREIQMGIEKGAALHPASLGVDTWGVDFALLDCQGRMLGNPVHYRDSRTDGVMERVLEHIPKSVIFNATGIQFSKINTLYQLVSMAESGSPQLNAACTFLTIPDLFNYLLTGVKVNEFSISSTTQMLDISTRDWAFGMLEEIGIPTHIFSEVVQPGTRLGVFHGIPVMAPACHDTGSAVAGVPCRGKNFGYISSGTWSLAGLEVEAAFINEEALKANVTNEGGVYGSYRLLKNIIGLWIIQQCRATWKLQGELVSYDELAELARVAEPFRSLIDPDDPFLLVAGDHIERIQTRCRAQRQPIPETKGAIVRAVLESLALKYRQVFDELTSLTGRKIDTIHIMGGGSQNHLLNQFTANATGYPVVAGPVEATVLGNSLVQLITLGEIKNLAEGRQTVARMKGMKRYEPYDQPEWNESYKRFLNLQRMVKP